ncbi:MAG TPA: substrate-binding domain-containing protein [Xanthobacteraceae bacterium]|nr:substrate-binding domain-containing protein [Xanthobacteraceae bacterium]
MSIRSWVFAVLAAPFCCNSALSSDLEVVGTGDGMELLQSIAAAYSTERPGNAVTVPLSIGSGGAIVAVGAERNTLGRIARPLTEKERAQGLIEAPIMRIPSAIYVHRSSGVTGLTTGQLADIYSGALQNWNEVGGSDLRIKVVRREEADSTLLVLRSSMPRWRDLKITPRSKLAMTTQEAVETVKEVEGAIGFGPYSRSLEAATTVLRIDGKHPIDDGYPSAVTLALLYKEGALTQNAEAFLNFVRSPTAHQLMANWGGVPVR